MVRHEGTPAQRTDAGSGLATISTEESSLLSATSSNNATSTSRCRVARSTGTIVVVLFAGILFLAISFRWRHHETTADPAVAKFPNDFVWGVATSAYQIEGSTLEDGRGLTIWDTFVQSPHAVLDHSTGAVADDHYHRWEEDVALMKRLDIKAYRFSIAWSRILPTGQGTVINEAGVRFYNRLIDVLLLNGIEPWITLFHWDLPQALQDDFGGWLSNSTIDAFYNYSHVVFDRFGKKVKRFITLNEPWTL